MTSLLNSILAHPLTKALDLDDPRTTELRLEIIRTKPFLRKIYDEWYRMIQSRIPAGDGEVLELGSGAGYLHRFVPEVIRSEVFPCATVELVADACLLPIATRIKVHRDDRRVSSHTGCERLPQGGSTLPATRRENHHGRAVGNELVQVGVRPFPPRA